MHAQNSFIHSFNQSINQSINPTNKLNKLNKLSIIQHSTFNIHEIKTNKHKHKNLPAATFTLIIMWFHSFIHSLHFHMQIYWMIVHKVPTFTKYQSQPNEEIHDQKLINSIHHSKLISIHSWYFYPSKHSNIHKHHVMQDMTCMLKIHSFIHSINQSINQSIQQTNLTN